VIEQEGLQEHALEVGNFMIKHLKELQKVHPLIGDVRYCKTITYIDLLRKLKIA
jgi:4-aminobutyrate aminotransferase-like enzyme